MTKKLKIALVHDSMQIFGGAERVLLTLHKMFPDAPIYTLYAKEKVVDERFPDADIYVSFLQSIPNFLKLRFRFVALFAIHIIENINLFKYDVVISSSAFFGKGVITGVNTRHIAYCHTPPRVLWRIDKFKFNIFSALPLHILRIWDVNSSYRPTQFVANSNATKKRIKKFYDKDSTIIYPPVEVEGEEVFNNLPHKAKKKINDILPSEFYLVVSSMTEHKRIDVIISAFSKMNYNLVVIGEGSLYKKLKKSKGGSTIFLGYQPDSVVYECMRRCKALINASEEDFGIVMVESMMCGKPVLAFRKGGALEIIEEGKTGEFFDSQNPAVLADGVRRMSENIVRNQYDEEYIKKSVDKYKKDNFIEAIKEVVCEDNMV